MRNFMLSNELWETIAPLLPVVKKSPLGGRPRLNLKKVFEGISWIKANHLPWQAAREGQYGQKTALNDYYRAWAKAGVFHALREAKILNHPELIGIDFDWEKIEKIYKHLGHGGNSA